MILSLGGLLFPGEHSERSVIVGAFVLGLLLAWGLTKGYGDLWRWCRERWWLAHAFLSNQCLKVGFGDPVDGSVSERRVQRTVPPSKRLPLLSFSGLAHPAPSTVARL
jgi:hypothetical protein